MIEKAISILITVPKHWGKSNIYSITKRIELTTKAEPIFREFKVLGGFCVSSSLAFGQTIGRA
jgi:hypothetical protein